MFVHDVETSLAGVNPAPFSPVAFETLKDQVMEFIAQLVWSAQRVATRYQSDTISPAHVLQATQYLAAPPRRFSRHVGTVGGILLGAALSNVLAMVSDGQYSTSGVVSSVTLIVIGTFMVAFHIGAEPR